jgi:hypothetical protein
MLAHLSDHSAKFHPTRFLVPSTLVMPTARGLSQLRFEPEIFRMLAHLSDHSAKFHPTRFLAPSTLVVPTARGLRQMSGEHGRERATMSLVLRPLASLFMSMTVNSLLLLSGSVVSSSQCITWWGWGLVEWLERCASVPMITSSNPSGGSEFIFRSDLLLTARGGCTRALLVEFACLPCYPGKTLWSQRLEPPGRAGIGAIQIPKCIFIFLFIDIALLNLLSIDLGMSDEFYSIELIKRVRKSRYCGKNNKCPLEILLTDQIVNRT